MYLHVLPSENFFIVNLSNLNDESRIIKGTLKVADLGIDQYHWYRNPRDGCFDQLTGPFSIERGLEPWSAQTAEIKALDWDSIFRFPFLGCAV